MRSWTTATVGMAASAMLLTGCVTAQQWNDWKSHSSHFASGEHMMFSVRTPDNAKQVRRADVNAAREQGWWGTPITVDQAQVQER